MGLWLKIHERLKGGYMGQSTDRVCMGDGKPPTWLHLFLSLVQPLVPLGGLLLLSTPFCALPSASAWLPCSVFLPAIMLASLKGWLAGGTSGAAPATSPSLFLASWSSHSFSSRSSHSALAISPSSVDLSLSTTFVGDGSFQVRINSVPSDPPRKECAVPWE